jgi:type IV pilus assembly protein PilX
MHMHNPHNLHRPSGFALVMALIFLVVISMLAISASHYALLQERMAGSLRNAMQARMSAETALRGVEYKLWLTAMRPVVRLHCADGAISRDDGCVIYRPDSAPYATNGDVTRFRSAPGWLPGVGVPYLGPARRGYTSNPRQPTAALAKDPVYIIEDMGREHAPGVSDLHESGNTGPDNDDQPSVHMYRITARATGGKPNVISIMQSTFDAPSLP